MAYTPYPSTDVENWEHQYGQLNTSLPNQPHDTARAKVTAQMQSLATRAEERLLKDIRLVRQSYDQHSARVIAWHAQAQNELKQASAAAADFKKNPEKTELVAQIKRSAQLITGISHDLSSDALDFGQSWFGYRGFNAGELPLKHVQPFYNMRSRLMGEQKVLGVKGEQIDRMKEQADALLAITGKAQMKSKIKAGTGAQRAIGVAQQAARDLATEMDTALTILKNPVGLNPRPSSITSALNTLTNFAANKQLTANPANRIAADSMWKNADGAYKLMASRAASMEKIFATRLKGLRSSELTDPTVKAQVAIAKQKVADAKAEIKQYDAAYAKSKKLAAQIEAAFKKAKA